MKEIQFYKFDGAGNDFVLLDGRGNPPQLTAAQIAQLCHRRFGIGADGLMLLLDGADGCDFRMRYYNSDGHPADMCGNGGRCIALFAHLLGLGSRPGVMPFSRCASAADASAASETPASLRFVADDGLHDAFILRWDARARSGVVKLGMRDVPGGSVRTLLDGCLLNTGVPHYVQRVADLEHFDVVGEGRRLRHHPALGPEGANVNFVQEMPDGTLRVRTYERGVEDETWACGTGVTACAIATGICRIDTRGGHFRIDFTRRGGDFVEVFLTGPVSLNFVGDVFLQ